MYAAVLRWNRLPLRLPLIHEFAITYNITHFLQHNFRDEPSNNGLVHQLQAALRQHDQHGKRTGAGGGAFGSLADLVSDLTKKMKQAAEEDRTVTAIVVSDEEVLTFYGLLDLLVRYEFIPILF